MKIFIGTLLSALGSFYFSDEKEKLRQAVNAWIRTSNDFDGVIDFEAVTRDPARLDQLKPDFDSGDHLHSNAAGYKAMGSAIDLSLFQQTCWNREMITRLQRVCASCSQE